MTRRDRFAWWVFRHLARPDTAHIAQFHYQLKMDSQSVVYTMPNGSTSGFYKPTETFEERMERRYQETFGSP